MSWDRIFDVALYAYPREMRDRVGTEMRDTALELSAGSRRRLISESFSLISGGLRARGGAPAPASKREMVADCCARAVTVWSLVTFALLLGWERLNYTPGHKIIGVIAEGLPATGLLALAAGLSLVGYRRLAGLAGIASIGFILAGALSPGSFLLWHSSSAYHLRLAASYAVPTACYLVMVLAPAARRRSTRHLAWLLVVGLLGGISASPYPPVRLFPVVGLSNVLLLSVAIAGTYSLAVNVWRSIGFAVALIAFGIMSWTTGSLPVANLFDYLHAALTTLAPVALIATAAARLVSARRGLPG